jgi:F-type H+-transporting ATPase subunit b
MPTTALLGAASFTDLNFGLTVWTIVVFALFAFLVTKLGWKPILSLIEERERQIRSAVETAQHAQTEAQSLLVQQKEVLREAGRQREDIVKRAFQEAESLRADLFAQARAESERMVQKAREQIELEKRLALEEIRAQVADLAILAAGKIVESSMTPEAQRKLVDEFLRDIPAAR